MKIILVVLLLVMSTVVHAGDAEKAAQLHWRPIIYFSLNRNSQLLIDALPLVDSRSNIVLHSLLKNLNFKNCRIESQFQNEYVQIVVQDLKNHQVYQINFPKFKSRAGQVFNVLDPTSFKLFGSEYFMAVTDTEEGLFSKKATYTAEIRVSGETGEVLEVRFLSKLKTIYNGILLGPIGQLLRQKPVEKGLDLLCKN